MIGFYMDGADVERDKWKSNLEPLAAMLRRESNHVGVIGGPPTIDLYDHMALLPGQKLGPYQILALLGASGMGQVYSADDTRLHRTVAIKVLPHEKVADAERRRRFLQEARATSALNHPNIVTLHDMASDSGVDYLVMEFVRGKSLDKLITGKGLPLPEGIGYATEIACALAAAHAAGIVHRDIKPANVIVTAESQVKVLDFGLAKLVELAQGTEDETKTQAQFTEAGMVMGTVAYMSPEQASAHTVDHRTDIFSLGVMLYEMIAGRRPFQRKTLAETMSATIKDPAPPLVEQPPELEEILAKALAKDPKDRYQHAGDLALDLRRFLDAWQSKSLPSMRHTFAAVPKTRWLWIAATLGLLLVVPAAWWLGRLRATGSFENPLANARFTRLTDFEGAELAAEISPDGKFVAFISDRDGPFDLWLTQVGTGRFLNLSQGKLGEVLEPTRSTGFSGDGTEVWLRGGPAPNQAPIRLMPLMGGPPRPFLPNNSVAVSWSRDGSRIVYHTGSTKGDPIFVADRTGANAKQVFIDPDPGGHCHYPVWSPDGNWIYFVRGIQATGEMDIWRVTASGGPPERFTNRNVNIGSLAPIDARTLLYVSPAEDGSGPWLYALDLESRASHRISYGLEQYLSVAASGDGRRLVATVANPSAALRKIPILDHPAREADVKPFVLPTVRALAPRFGAGSLFYLSSLGGGDGLWRYREGQVLEIWRGAESPLLEPPAISADGKRVAILIRRQGKVRVNVMSEDGTGASAAGDDVDARGSASWSPDGRWIAVGGQDAKGPGLFKIPVERGPSIRLTDTPAFNPVWSPDGNLIIYSGPVAGRYQPLQAVRPDGTAVELPAIKVRYLGERYRFLPNGKGLVYMGLFRQQDFALLDLTTMTSRTLTHLDNPANMRTFDITSDGKEIVFDRLKENSDIVLVDLPK